MSTSDRVRYETNDAAALITINRPERMNALDPETGNALFHAIERANAAPEIGAMVVTGTGKAFCAGADIGAVFQKGIDDKQSGGERPSLLGTKDWVGFIRESKPIVAAINGVAIGVGLTMTLPMDVIMTCPQAKFRLGFIKMGLVPELASSHFLAQRVGFGIASEMALTGRDYSGEEAHALGLADRIAPAEELVQRAVALAQRMAENPDPQLRMIKALLTQNLAESDLKAVQSRELKALDAAYQTPEHKEAVAAFLEKRAAKFR